jgi:hypothetical protein
MKNSVYLIRPSLLPARLKWLQLFWMGTPQLIGETHAQKFSVCNTTPFLSESSTY